MTIKNQIQDLIEKLKKDPMDFNARLALIQYYCIDANWEKALKATHQYSKLNSQDQNAKILFQYNIECEITRLTTFKQFNGFNSYSGQSLALENQIMTSFCDNEAFEVTEQYFVDLVNQNVDQHELFADQTAEGVWIDTDFRLNGLLEIFVQNQYHVLKINEIKELTIKDNQYFTDLLWRRAEIVLKDNRHISCFIPARYPILDDETISDAVKLNKTTEWQMKGNLSIAQGQKTLTNGDIDIGLLDIRRLQLIQG